MTALNSLSSSGHNPHHVESQECPGSEKDTGTDEVLSAHAEYNHAGSRSFVEEPPQAVKPVEVLSLFDRELFFALQPRDRLERMVERYRDAF